MIIVIDGLSGSGKSTTARAVAGKLDIQYIDSGALYRAATLIWLDTGKNKRKFLENLLSKDVRFEYKDNRFLVYINGTDVSTRIRKQEVSEDVSLVATMPEVRKYVNGLMRKVVGNGRYIADGRDLGTAVFPDADLKFFMEASLDVRAKRRHAEMKNAGESVTLEDVKKNLLKRDSSDKTRQTDPLIRAEDAHLIDTTGKTFDEQVQVICTIISEKLLMNNNL
jgi:CMP/dCMP kinase